MSDKRVSRVSVVVPSFNKERSIRRTLSSIFAQDFRDFEVLVVDDESTDGSLAEIKKFTDPRLRVFCQKNQGPGATRNFGIHEARYEYVAFLDADDEWLPNFLSTAMRCLEENKDCTAFCGGRYWEPGRINREDYHRKIGITRGPWRLDPETQPAEMKKLQEFFFSGAIVAKREILLEYGGFYENRCTFQEDTWLWLQWIVNQKVYRDPSPVMVWHRENSQLSAGRRTRYPMLPILADPEPIRKNCPAKYRETLERFLEYIAAENAKRFLRYGDGLVTRELLRRFPQRGLRRIKGGLIYSMSYLSPFVRLARTLTGKTI